MLYGANNPVDGAVLQVILRKAERIRKELGVSVPMPEDSNKVMQAVMESVLLKGGSSPQAAEQLKLDLFAVDSKVEEAWQSAKEKAKRSQTIFAQRKLKPYLAFRRARQALTNEVLRYATHDRYIDLSALLDEPEKFAEHHKTLCSFSDEALLRSAAVCVGAVRKEPLPFGEVPTESVYDAYTRFI